MNTMNIKHRFGTCHCGKALRKHSRERCPACEKARHEALLNQARIVVAVGLCPVCNGKLKRNLALAGWWQCEQFGAVGFRKDSAKPSCNFQTFTV
jgi:hypothetical protein